MINTRIDSLINFDLPGTQSGFLRVPYSSNESAYGWLPVPVVVVKGEPGPTVLLLGGVHGDEYEGQLALARIARRMASAPLTGTLIVLPSTNAPAALAGRRLSPIDGVNLNRAFPGDVNGSPSQMIAHYMEEILLPRADAVIDLHSGGGSLEYLPCVRARLSPDEQIRRRTLELVHRFGAPFGVLFRPARGEPRTLSAACERKGVVYINPETGGAARVDRAALQIAHDGVLRSLAALGMIPAEDAPEARVSTRLATLAAGSLVFSEHDGVWEPQVDLGHHVTQGDVIAAVHDLKRPWQDPVQVRSPVTGTVLCQRACAPVSLGDCLFEIGVPLEMDSS